MPARTDVAAPLPLCGGSGRANSTIDDAALEAGRRSSDVRRLLNIGGTFGAGHGSLLDGPPRQWAERLAELTLTSGFATYILASDDADRLARFGQEVAPDLRERVAAERERAGTTTHG
jgi:hypothetical protein